MNGESKILGLDGQPLKASDAKRYAIVGTTRVHYTVYELKEGEDMAHAIRTHQIMQSKKDPKLMELTQSVSFFWAEDDNTRQNNRTALAQQFCAFLGNLGFDGTTQVHMDSFALAGDLLKKEGRDETPLPPSAA